MDPAFPIVFVGILVLALVGNGFYSWITLRKPVQASLSALETFAISLGIGLTFIVLYGFCVDLVVSAAGLIPNSQSFILVGIPTCMGVVLKLSSIKVRIGKAESLWAHLISQLKRGKERAHRASATSNFQLLKGKKRTHTVLLVSVSIITLFIFLEGIYRSMNLSPAQFSLDPYFWVRMITEYVATLTIEYPTLGAYTPGILPIEGFFLAFLPTAAFSTQYYFLKWVPFLNLCLCLFLLYVIHKRVSTNPAFFLVVFFLTLNKYFYYRITILLPSPLTIIFLEVFLLQMLIPGIPRFLAYLTLATTLLIHPINGVIICGCFLAYKVVEGLTRIIRRTRTRHQSPRTMIPHTGWSKVKILLGNVVAFCLPISIYAICQIIRNSPDWWKYYLSSMETNMGLIYVGSPGLSSVSPVVILQAIFTEGTPDYSTFWARVGWIPTWGCGFFWLTLGWLFLPQKLYIDASAGEKHKFVLFLRISILLAFFIFLLPGLVFLLDLIEILPGGVYIVHFINSYFYDWASYRVFEVSNLLNALFLVMILEGGLKKVFRQVGTIHLGPPKANVPEILCIALITTYLFSGSFLTFRPYYEYQTDATYVDTSLWLRDYLDQHDPGPRDIQYTREDAGLSLPLSVLLNPVCNLTQVCCNVSLGFLASNFTSNPANPVEYLVISFHGVNDTIAADIRATYLGSSYQLYYNGLILILKF